MNILKFGLLLIVVGCTNIQTSGSHHAIVSGIPLLASTYYSATQVTAGKAITTVHGRFAVRGRFAEGIGFLREGLGVPDLDSLDGLMWRIMFILAKKTPKERADFLAILSQIRCWHCGIAHGYTCNCLDE